MSDRIAMNQLYANRVPPAIGPRTNKVGAVDQSRVNGTATSFQQVLNEKMIHFSHHAEQRLKQRGIEIQPEQMVKLASAIDQAARKGANDSLILMQDVALIVNIKNKTVVTAMDGASMKDNVFTQIDSAVIVS